MVDTSFFFFITVAVLSYGIQGSLQTTFARKYDAFVVVLYRNISLAVTMSPVLLFVTREQIFEIFDHLWLLFAASGLGAVSILLALSSSKYLPIGISTAIRQVIQIIVAIFLGIVFFSEWLTLTQVVLIATITFIGVALALLKSDHPHLDPQKLLRGVLLTTAAGIIVAHAFFFFGALSREVNPFVAGYFWEVGVGVFALMYFCVLNLLGKYEGSVRIPLRDASKIAGIALLTISATSSYAFALSMGPYALAAGLLTATTLVASVMGWVIYNERLTKFQIGLIVAAVALMFLLKAFS